MSIIVIGISSVILGIAVNYPLHLTDHLSHAPDMKTTLREIVQPLVVGNVTTVGAFLTLVPLKSAALRDLGLFSAFLLAGTILFVLLWLPQLAERRERSGNTLLTRLGNVRLEDKRWLVAAVVVLTFFFGYYSLRTTFDSDLSHINYMTEEQRATPGLCRVARQYHRWGAGREPSHTVATAATAGRRDYHGPCRLQPFPRLTTGATNTLGLLAPVGSDTS